MAARVAFWLFRPSLLRTLVSHARLSARLLREPRVPLLLKALPIAAGLYVISPLDIVPDVIPLVGQLDDLGLMLLALQAFVKWCPGGAVDFHRAAVGSRRRYSPMPQAGEFIDAEFRREESPRYVPVATPVARRV